LFNGDVTTLLTHSDLSSDVTYFGAANYLPANADAGGHTLTNALHQALTPSSWLEAQRLPYLGTDISYLHLTPMQETLMGLQIQMVPES